MATISEFERTETARRECERKEPLLRKIIPRSNIPRPLMQRPISLRQDSPACPLLVRTLHKLLRQQRCPDRTSYGLHEEERHRERVKERRAGLAGVSAAAARQRRHVDRPDLRGVGNSDRPQGGYDKLEREHRPPL